MNYLSHITPGFEASENLDSLIDSINSSGLAVIGTPAMAINQIRRLQEKSGGFGKFLVLHGEWAPTQAALRSFELIAQQVAPHFNGDLTSRKRGFDQTVNSNRSAADITQAGQAEAQKRFEDERTTKAH